MAHSIAEAAGPSPAVSGLLPRVQGLEFGVRGGVGFN